MHKKIFRRLSFILLEFENYILKLAGFVPFHHVRRFVYRLFGMKIGKGSTLHMGAVFYKIKNIEIGEDTIIGEDAVLDGREKLSIGNHVDLASGVMIYNSQHNVNSPDFAKVEEVVKEEVIIGDYVFVGPRAIILPGVKIGKGVIVGAGAVVTKDVSDFQIVGGVPAKVIGERNLKDPKYKLGRAAWFR